MNTYQQVQAKTNNICFNCINGAGGCSWSDGLKPVKGWLAELSFAKGKPYTWRIIECPEFEEGDRFCRGRNRQSNYPSTEAVNVSSDCTN